ncbi:MAG: hypothetical protein WCI95_12535 [bacterium]
MKKVHSIGEKRMRKFEEALAKLEKQQEKRFAQLLKWVDSLIERPNPAVRHRDPPGFTIVTEDWGPCTLAEMKETGTLKTILTAVTLEQLESRLKTIGKTLEEVFHLLTDDQIKEARQWADYEMANINCPVSVSPGIVIECYIQKYNMMRTDKETSIDSARGRKQLKHNQEIAPSGGRAAKYADEKIIDVFSEYIFRRKAEGCQIPGIDEVMRNITTKRAKHPDEYLNISIVQFRRRLTKFARDQGLGTPTELLESVWKQHKIVQ